MLFNILMLWLVKFKEKFDSVNDSEHHQKIGKKQIVSYRDKNNNNDIRNFRGFEKS